MKSAGAEVHHYDVTNDDKLLAEFLKAQMSMGSLNTAAQLVSSAVTIIFNGLKNELRVAVVHNTNTQTWKLMISTYKR